MPIQYKRKPASSSAQTPRKPRPEKPPKERPPLFKRKEKALPPPAEAPTLPPAQRPEDILRAEMLLPTSQTIPEAGGLLARLRLNLGRLAGIAALLAILGLIWVFAAGPGRPALEDALLALAARSASPTPTLTATLQVTATLPPTETAQPSATPLPTHTPAPPSATPTPAVSPTPESACREVSTFTLDDVGQEVCAQGTVMRLQKGEGWTLVVFTNQAGAMYWVTYDVPYETVSLYASPGACVMIVGVVENIENTPILRFNWRSLPEPCE